jgi:beta-lactamase regulating signal transducer with metallopeptidase domain
MTLPLIEISSVEQQPEMSENLMLMLQSAIAYSNTAGIELMQQPETATVTWLHAILLIYIAGVIFLPTRNIYSIIKLCLLVKNGRKQIIENNITLIVHNNNIAPFSWFKYIVISEKDFNENGNEIITHEKAHITKRHSIDLLICHIFNIIQWINPVAWLFKRELQNIHEYEADEAVIKKGISTKQYQMLLIKKAVGARLFALANNFNKCKLKKRIKMMSKNKSNPYSRLKYLYVLPMLAIVATAFASPQMKSEMEKISSVSISDLIAQSEMNENENSNAADSITVTVFNETESNDSIIASDTVSSTTSVITITNGNSNDTIFIKHPENGTILSNDALFIVDGEIVDDINNIDANLIESVSVIKKPLNAKKDDRGKSSVVLIQTKTGKDKTQAIAYASCDSIFDKPHLYVIKRDKNTSDSIAKKHKRMYIDAQNLAGSLKNIYFEQFPNLDSLKYQNFNLNYWNDSVTTWNLDFKKMNLDSAWNFDLKYPNFNFDSYEYDFNIHPLVIVDGKEMKFDDIAKMGSQIGTITVLKDKQAIEKYGMKAMNGVIIIETKKNTTKNKE